MYMHPRIFGRVSLYVIQFPPRHSPIFKNGMGVPDVPNPTIVSFLTLTAMLVF